MRFDAVCTSPGCQRRCWWVGEGSKEGLMGLGWRFVKGFAICPDHVRWLEAERLFYQERLFD